MENAINNSEFGKRVTSILKQLYPIVKTMDYNLKMMDDEKIKSAIIKALSADEKLLNSEVEASMMLFSNYPDATILAVYKMQLKSIKMTHNIEIEMLNAEIPMRKKLIENLRDFPLPVGIMKYAMDSAVYCPTTFVLSTLLALREMEVKGIVA